MLMKISIHSRYDRRCCSEWILTFVRMTEQVKNNPYAARTRVMISSYLLASASPA